MYDLVMIVFIKMIYLREVQITYIVWDQNEKHDDILSEINIIIFPKFISR